MTNWKKLTALTAASLLAVSAMGCQSKKDAGSEDIDIADVVEATEDTAEAETPAEVVSDLEASITWWTYPVFVQDEDQADGTYEQTLIRKFNEKYPNIKVELKLLDYTDGPTMIDEQIKAEGGELPNVLLDEPGRISTYAKDGIQYS